MTQLSIIFGVLWVVFPAFAWEGYDYGKGSYVEIEKGNLVRPGQEIEIYDYGAGEYKNVRVESIRNQAWRSEIEVFDYNSGEYRTFDMDK